MVAPRSAGAGQAQIEVAVALEHSFHRESLTEPDQSRLAHVLLEERGAEDPSNRAGHGAGIPGSDQKTCLAIGDRIGDAADIRSDHRDTLAHRLEDHERQTLHLRGEDENVGGSEQVPWLGERSRKRHYAIETQGMGAIAHGGKLRAIPRQHGTYAGELREQRRHRIHDHSLALGRGEVRQADDDGTIARQTQSGADSRIDPGGYRTRAPRDDLQLFAMEAAAHESRSGSSSWHDDRI